MSKTLGSTWIPAEGITRHAGSPIPPDLDFFVAPPAEIGKVVSADSTLTVSTHPLPLGKRFFRSFLVGVGFACLIWLILNFFIKIQSDLTVLGVGTIATVWAYFTFNVFDHKCSYVGEQGIVEYSIRNSRLAQPQVRLMCFKDAANLYTSRIIRYRNYSYRGTSYTYAWQMIGKKAYQLSGSYYKERGWPDDKDYWHFANSAEASWTSYLLQGVNQQLQRLGYIEFPMQGNPKAVRVGNGFLEFVLKDDSTQRVAVADMKDTDKLQSGIFRFTHKDARWWSGKGKYEFNYSNLPNANLFLLCLRQLTGIQS
jgi:hypothetical protein